MERSEEALEWIEKNAELYDLNGFCLLVPMELETFTPLNVELVSLKTTPPAMAWVARERGREKFEVMLPSGVKSLIINLKSLNIWNENEEPNVLIFQERDDLRCVRWR